MNAVVVGLGLIGGSVALALRETEPAVELVGVDRAFVIERPAARRLAETFVDVADPTGVEAAFARADLVVLAPPIRAIVELLPKALAKAAVVTDCGSTKRSIARAAEESPRRARFVPGHPMAGGPEGGAEHARANLFRGRSWLLCTEGSDADAVGTVEAVVRRFGAQPLRVSAADHDRAVALTSHATQLLSSALAVVASRAGAEPMAGPAFEGATRAAGGPDGIWGDILSSNADEIARALGEIEAELRSVREALERPSPDVEVARALLQRARRVRRG